MRLKTSVSGIVLVLSLGTAQAMPKAGSIAAAPSNAAMPVADGCGPFGHRGFDGECHRNRGPGIGIPPIFGGHRRDFDDDRRQGFNRRDDFHRRDEVDRRDGLDRPRPFQRRIERDDDE